MFPYLRLGPFLLQTPGLALLAGLWAGSWLTEKETARIGLNQEQVNNLIFSGLLLGIIGARLGYAIQYISVYAAQPFSLFALNPNTLNPAAGVLVGIFAAGFYKRRKHLPLRPVLDALAPGLAVFMVAFGAAHILSGDAFGSPLNGLRWSIYLWNEYRHPSQFYETLAALVVLALTQTYRLGQPGSGVNFLTVVALSTFARIVLEAFRGDSVVWPGGFRAAQIIGIIVLVVVLCMIGRWSQPQSMAIQEGQV